MLEVVLHGAISVLVLVWVVDLAGLLVDGHHVWQHLERFAWYRRRVGGTWVRISSMRLVDPIRWVQGEPTKEDLRVREFHGGIIVSIERY